MGVDYRIPISIVLVSVGLIGSAAAQTGPLPAGQIIVGPIARGKSFPANTVGPPPITDGQGTTVPQITNGAEADTFLLTQINTPSTPSFINSTTSPVVALLTTAPVQYVRFYAPGTNQAGAFLVPSNYVRGLTAAQIKDVLALPFMPTSQTVVQLPAGACLVIGTAGPILSAVGPPAGVWGNGGAVQVYLVGKNVGGSCGTGVPGFTGSFINGQSIGSGALLYAPHVGGGNVGAVAASLDKGPFPVQFSGMDGLYSSLDVLNTGGDPTPLRTALLQLDGEVHASTQTVLLGDSLYLRQAVMGRMRQVSFTTSTGPTSALGLSGPTLAYADPRTSASRDIRSDYDLAFDDEPQQDAPKTEFWVQAVGAWGRFQGNTDAAAATRNLAGFFAGVDRRFEPNWYAGVAGGYTNSSVGIADRSSAATIGSVHVAGYTGASFGPLNLRAAVAGSFNTVDTSRSVNFPGFSDAESARYHATTTQVFAEAGYGFALGKVAVEPFAAVSFAHVDTDAFIEAGGPAALSVSASSSSLAFSTLGIRTARNFELPNDMILTPHASVGWQHAYGNVAPTSTATFVSHDVPFTVSAAPLASDVAVVEAGLDLRLGRQLTFSATYFGQISSGVQDTWLTGSLSWRF